MHHYGTDSEEKKTVIFLLVISSIFATWLLYELLASINALTGFVAPWWIEIPSVLGFYGFFYKVFDKWLWKNRLVQKLGLVKIPNFSGVWKGYLLSSKYDLKGKIEAEMQILQTWTSIEIYQKTKQSTGKSFVASILTKNVDSPRLFIMYQNTPKIDAAVGMHSHTGSAELVLDAGKVVLTGKYYNCGRDRMTYGSLRFEKN